MLLEAFVSQRREGSLPVWRPGPVFLLGGVYVSCPMFLPGGLCLRSRVPSGCLSPGGLCPETDTATDTPWTETPSVQRPHVQRPLWTEMPLWTVTSQTETPRDRAPGQSIPTFPVRWRAGDGHPTGMHSCLLQQSYQRLRYKP